MTFHGLFHGILMANEKLLIPHHFHGGKWNNTNTMNLSLKSHETDLDEQ